MKTKILSSLAVVILALGCRSVQTGSTRAKATLAITEILTPGMYLESPSTVEKTQYFKIIERHVLVYQSGGKTFAITNDVPTGRIVEKTLTRTARGWIEVPPAAQK